MWQPWRVSSLEVWGFVIQSMLLKSCTLTFSHAVKSLLIWPLPILLIMPCLMCKCLKNWLQALSAMIASWNTASPPWGQRIIIKTSWTRKQKTLVQCTLSFRLRWSQKEWLRKWNPQDSHLHTCIPPFKEMQLTILTSGLWRKWSLMPLKPSFRIVLPVARIVSVPSNFWRWQGQSYRNALVIIRDDHGRSLQQKRSVVRDRPEFYPCNRDNWNWTLKWSHIFNGSQV